MLTKRYMASVKSVPAILDKIVSGTAPPAFTTAHLKNIGFASSNDRAIIPMLKDLGFLSADGAPTKRYHEYRNASRSRKVLGEALREVYEPIFHLNAQPVKSDREAIEGIFKSTHNVGERIAEAATSTFFAFLDKADISEDSPAPPAPSRKRQPNEPAEEQEDGKEPKSPGSGAGRSLHLRHNIEVHLPATKDIEVYNAIFKSLKEHLID